MPLIALDPARDRRPRLRIVALVVVTTAALAVGTVGGAQAGALTEKTVKKIAAKVVKQKAPRLRVKHAKTATTATLLAGATADQLRTTEYRYGVPAIGATSVVNYEFPGLPAGSYQVSYWYRATTTVPDARVGCDVSPSPSDFSVAESTSVTNGAGMARGGATGGLTTTDGPLRLVCITSSGTMTMFGQVSFVRVDTVVPGTAVGS